MDGKCIVNQVKGYGSMRFGMEMPKNAVYGTYRGVPWMCIDLNFYPDGKSIDVLVYRRKSERWRRERLDSGPIYEILTQYIAENGLLGRPVKYALRLRGTFQANGPAGRKRKVYSSFC
ncbi:hypothetical protein D7Y05_09380 [bacterium 1XD42-54]|nr:hypothetical protein D7Y05_09380 [bacterium 1XD42-54]